MRFLISLRVLVWVGVALGALGCGAELVEGVEAEWLAYGPAVSLTGTIVEETYGEDAAPNDRGYRVWILRLDRPISVRATPGSEIDLEEREVTEVHLNISHRKFSISRKQMGTVRFEATGTLYHQINSHHLRAVMMLGTDLKPVRAK